MLFITNKDRPGFIGRLGTVLGEAGINIATFNLGRNRAGGDAIALIEVDEEPGETVLDQIRAIPNVIRVKALAF
jgi:D-3-phosphoglycerate dehydrogenase